MRKLFFGLLAIKTLVVLFVLFLGGVASAAPPTDEQANACQAALEENFNAINYEDIDRLMASIAVTASGPEMRADFHREAMQLFEDADVYVHLAFFDPFWVKGNKLRAMVVQTTTVVGDEDGTSTLNGLTGTGEFLTRSNLLPPWRHSYYLQEFEYDKKSKKWLVGAIIGRPKSTFDPVKAPPNRFREQNAATGRTAGNDRCTDGTCSTPLVRVKMK